MEVILPDDETLSIRVPMDDMTVILTQLWKSRGTEPKVGKL